MWMIWCKGQYAIGTVTSDYYFVSLEENIPHRRKVKWNPDLIDREQFMMPLNRVGPSATYPNTQKNLKTSSLRNP